MVASPSKLHPSTLPFIAKGYLDANFQNKIGADRVLVLVYTHMPIPYQSPEAQHLREHGLAPISHLFDDEAGWWFIECETNIGYTAGLKALDSCGFCRNFVKEIRPNHMIKIPPEDERRKLWRSGFGVSPQDQGPHALVAIKNTVTAIGVPKVWAALGTPPYGGENGGCKELNVGHFDTGAPLNADDRFWPDWMPANTVPAPKSRIVFEKSYAGSNTNPIDINGHGTRTLAIIASQGVGEDPTSGDQGDYKGILYRASLYCFKVLDDDGSGAYSWLAAAIIDSRNYPLHVCTMSIGGPEVDPALEGSINANVRNHGQIWVIAAGNSGQWDSNSPHAFACDKSLNSPGSAGECFVCGASDTGNPDPNAPPGSEFVQTWSSRPPAQDGRTYPQPPRTNLNPNTGNYAAQFYLIGPGLGISTKPNEPGESGTSFSTPHIAGVIGQLVYAITNRHPDPQNGVPYQTIQQIREALLKNTHELGYWTGGSQHWTQSEAYCIEGWGRVDAYAAYQAITGAPPTTRKGQASKSLTGSVTIHPQSTPPTSEPTTLTVQADKTDYTSRDTVKITAKLTFTSDGAPLAARTVKTTFANSTVDAMTDGSGTAVASFTAPDVNADTDETYFAQFAGDP